MSYTRGMSIISLICNVQRTSEILERVFRVLGAQDVNVKMMSQVQRLLLFCPCTPALQLPSVHDYVCWG